MLVHVRWIVKHVDLTDIAVDGRMPPETVSVNRSQFSAQEVEDLSVELERPALDTLIPKDELRNLKKDEKKRQEVINGNTVFHCQLCRL